MRRTAEISVSRKARKRDGTYYLLPADRLNISIQAGGSKAVRNAILNALPIGLVDGYFGEAKAIAARGGKIAEKSNPVNDAAQINAQMEECVARLLALGIVRSEVDDYVNRHPELQNEEAVCAHFIGLLNAVDDGQVNIEDVFTAPEKPISEPQRASAPAPQPPAARQTPPPSTPPKGRELPKDRRRMQAKLSGSMCGACHNKVVAGQWIWRNPDTNNWEHEVC